MDASQNVSLGGHFPSPPALPGTPTDRRPMLKSQSEATDELRRFGRQPNEPAAAEGIRFHWPNPPSPSGPWFQYNHTEYRREVERIDPVEQTMRVTLCGRSPHPTHRYDTAFSFLPAPPPEEVTHGPSATSPGPFDIPSLSSDMTSDGSTLSTPDDAPSDLQIVLPGMSHILPFPPIRAKGPRDDGLGLGFGCSHHDPASCYAASSESVKPHSIPWLLQPNCNSHLYSNSAENPTRDSMPVDSAPGDNTSVPASSILQENGKKSSRSLEVHETPLSVSGDVEGTKDISSHRKTKSPNAANASPRSSYHDETPAPKTPSLYDPSQSSNTPETEILTIDDSDSSATLSTDSISSGLGTPVKAESPYSEQPTNSILGEKGARILDELGCLFAKTILQRFGFRQCLGAAQSEGCGRGAGTTNDQCHDQGSGQSNQTTKRKRGDDADGQDNASGNGQGGKGPSQKRAKMQAAARQKIACPYMKRYPIEFSTWRTCPGPGFDGVNRMKEHLKRRHFKEISCARCGRQFETRLLLREHSRAYTACEVNDDPQRLGFMTQLQWDDIHAKRGNKMTDMERWKEMYKILFPDIDDSEIPGPYYDVTGATRQLGRLVDCDEYEAYLRQNLPQRIMTQLNREFQVMAEQARQRLVEIVQEQSAETLAAFLREKGLVQQVEDKPNDILPEGPLIQEDGSLWEMINDPALFQSEGLAEWMTTMS